MEKLKDRIRKLEDLTLDPFSPEDLRIELEDLLKEIPNMKREELIELSLFLQRLKLRLEENYLICFGWMEEALKRGFRVEI
ncbi:MAG: hypothetical protein ACK4OF_02705 [Aquificaceae bacterium]